MNKELLRHIEILKTIPEIKANIEELKFGCWYHGFDFNTDKEGYHRIMNIMPEWVCGETIDISGEEVHGYDFIDDNDGFAVIKIIGQVHEGHLRMFLSKYSKNNEIEYLIKQNGEIDKSEFCYNDDMFMSDFIITLDNSKPYMSQDESFFKKLNEWLVSEFKIKL